MEIKECEPHHLPALRDLNLESRRDSFHWLNTKKFTLEDFDRYTMGKRIWVAEVSGNFAGFISIWESEHFIHHLYVGGAYRGLGLGTSLIDQAQALYGELSLRCMVPNKQALLPNADFFPQLTTELDGSWIYKPLSNDDCDPPAFFNLIDRKNCTLTYWIISVLITPHLFMANRLKFIEIFLYFVWLFN